MGKCPDASCRRGSDRQRVRVAAASLSFILWCRSGDVSSISTSYPGFLICPPDQDFFTPTPPPNGESFVARSSSSQSLLLSRCSAWNRREPPGSRSIFQTPRPLAPFLDEVACHPTVSIPSGDGGTLSGMPRRPHLPSEVTQWWTTDEIDLAIRRLQRRIHDIDAYSAEVEHGFRGL